ncbi:MAG: hypothetical protein GY870_07865 [archaeon]|nr:hypothetical protein [archaeon]
MIRSEKMSLLTIYLNRELLTPYIREIVKNEKFHIKKSKKIIENNTKNKERKKLGIISEEKLKKIDNQMSLAKDYLDKMIKIANFDSENIFQPKKNERIQLEFDTLPLFINHIFQEIEVLHIELNGMSKKIEKLDHEHEEIAETASILNLSAKFGGENYSKNDFKKLTFDFYVSSFIDYNEFKLASEQLKSPIVCYGEEIGEDIISFFVFYEVEYKKLISDLLLSYHCQKIVIPERYVDNEGIHIDRLQEDHDKIYKKRKNLVKSYEKMVNNLHQVLLGYQELLNNTEKIVDLIKEMEQTPTHNLIKSEGFIPTGMEIKLVKTLQKQFHENIQIDIKHFEQTDPYEQLKLEEKGINEEKSPSFIKNSSFGKPFSALIDMHGTPNYSEIDPSFFIALTFPIIFGLMFGDVGHGLVLILAGLITFFKYKKKGKNTRLPLVIAYCGVGAIIGGFVYGEFFGEHLIIGGEHIMLLANPLHNVLDIVKMSVLIGVFMLCLGWAIKAGNLIINHKAFLAFADPIMKIVMMIGGTRLIFSFYFNIDAWLVPSDIGFGFPALFSLVITPAIFILILQPIGKLCGVSYLKHHKSFSLIGESMIELGETMLQIISNVSSFVRILALEMAHIALMVVVSELGNLSEMMGDLGMIYGIAILILGNAFVIMLEMIFALIHTLRLHFYEFFSKFFLGNGISFEPIIIKNTFCEINFPELLKNETSIIAQVKN